MNEIDFARLSPWFFVVAPLVVVAAYVVLGLSGFGSTIVSIPILAHFLPVSFLVPMMVVVDMLATFSINRSSPGKVAKGEMKWLVPFMFVGFGVGLWLLVGVPDRYLRAALGVFAVAIGLHGIANPVLRRRISKLWSVPTGLAGGAASTVFGAGGPIYASYLAGRLGDKGEIRATVASMITISALSRVFIYAASGLLLHKSLLIAMVALAPFAWVGLRIGSRIHVGLTNAQMRRVVGTLLLCTGTSLLIRLLQTTPSP